MSIESFLGILLGAISFLTIGVFHPIVIKSEYYCSWKCWPFFFVAGLIFCALSVVLYSKIGLFFASILAIVAFSCFWSIKELKEQEERVAKGWFPANPNRKDNKTK